MQDKDKKELEKAYQALIERKDKEIDKLKKDNMLLMRSALKRAEELEKIKELVEMLRKRKAKDQKA